MERIDYNNNELKKYIHKYIVTLKISFLREEEGEETAKLISLKVMIEIENQNFTPT